MASKSAQQEPEKAEVIEEALETVDKTLDRVKVLYEQYFLGIQKQPPQFVHADVERKLRDLAQLQIRNTALRYRFATLQQKFGSYNTYWRRTLREIEAGRYHRNLSKISRQAAATGAEIPQEILAAMPRRMREQVRRDREAALALQRRREGGAVGVGAEAVGAGGGAGGELLTLAPLEGEDSAGFVRETAEVRQQALRARAGGGGGRGGGGTHVLDESDAALDLDAFFRKVEAEGAGAVAGGGEGEDEEEDTILVAARVDPARVAAAAGDEGVGRAHTRESLPPGLPPGVDRPIAHSAQPTPETRTAPARPSTSPGTQPGIGPVRATGTGRPPTGPPVATEVPPIAPSQRSRPNPIAPGASSARREVDVETMTGPFPREAPDRPAPPPRSRPETVAARPPPVASQARPAATRAAAPPQPAPPPGMTDADVNALYAKYVKAKEMVGEATGPNSFGKLMQTIHTQAPKIMEQYRAKGVDFTVVIKDNQVVIRAKPKI